jgi:hypothetical protein
MSYGFPLSFFVFLGHESNEIYEMENAYLWSFSLCWTIPLFSII